MTRQIERLGVVGAGSMGSGIAELAITHGFPATLVDASADALRGGAVRIESNLAKAVEQGRSSREAADAALARLRCSTDPETLAGCDGVIEAVPERLELKRELLGRIAAICPAPALLATNTSSLRVSAIAAGIPGSERVVGMHFFNPAPRMRLVEVIAGLQSGEAAVQAAKQLGQRLGKQVIAARDGIGFLVNRTARPFYAEALRLVHEGIADFAQIDRICRMGGGFRMGPFELVDLIGVDVNLEISESFWFQSYGEPRWRPSPIQAQLVGAGRLGRKTGAGFHSYEEQREPDPELPATGGGDGRPVAIGGVGPVAEFLRAAATRAGFAPCSWNDPAAGGAWLAVEAEPARSLGPGRTAPVAARTILCASTCLRERRAVGASGFHLIGPVAESRLVEMTSVAATNPASRERAQEFFVALGLHVEEVGDAPGLVLGRIVSQLVNEAAFTLEEGIAGPGDIDVGARLGLNYPRGPVEWSAVAGIDQIRAILQALGRWRGEERYRLAPLVRSGGPLSPIIHHGDRPGRLTGAISSA